MTYQELKRITEGQPLPLAGKNEHGENVTIQRGNGFYKLVTAQHNGWIRTNYIYEDGTTEELYSR